MRAYFHRDQLVTAAIFGWFAVVWFGWAQAAAVAGLTIPLAIGSVLGLAVLIAGGVLAWRHRHAPSALAAPGAMSRFGPIVGLEFGLVAIGCVALQLLGRPELMAPFVCLVVGVHFLPLAPILRDPSLVGLGVVLILVAVAGVVLPAWRGWPAPAVVGAGAGAALLVTGFGALVRFWRSDRTPASA